MRAGDRIRLTSYCMGVAIGTQDYNVVEFRHCLGIFPDDEHKRAGKLVPLCELYEAGPDSESDYISHFGEYTTNMVPSYMNLQRPV